MPINENNVRKLLKTYDFKELFREELGWDRQNSTLRVTIGPETFTLQSIAEKRGMAVYVCETPDALPSHATRRKIEAEVAKNTAEHILIYTDNRTAQLWQWVRREEKKPAANREHTLFAHQSPERLIAKLSGIAFDVDDEDDLTLTLVTARTRKAFDIEAVTKRFYTEFKAQHDAFMNCIEPKFDLKEREWYTSVLLNRLMFLYFIQGKGFLDGDHRYLQNRLARIQQERGANQFHTFYRYFLLRLFHEGLAQRDPAPELEPLLGKIPYLNGGLFLPHQIENEHADIDIPDSAFEAVFAFFDKYDWRLDDRKHKTGNEINPDVLGFIFEKYINQREMGAYYTKEDITEYIGRSVIVPYLLETARANCLTAFEPNRPLWQMLRDTPDRYIFAAVRWGMEHALPDDIAAGIGDIGKRGAWNKPAPATHALPTETWREVVARRTHCAEIRTKLANGAIHDINDFITFNLDIRQFAEDAVSQCEGVDFLRAFWQAIETVRVLDPTVGSGAFLFAALNILEPLYEACLNRMEAFVAEDIARIHAERSGPTTQPADPRPVRYADFRATLARINAHPSRQYFVTKSIIISNLFGVDIMPEATEICKLRLFLKLAAQVASVDKLEPLPDIDFNIRAGNTLVGYARLADMERLWNLAQTNSRTGQIRMAYEKDTEALLLKAREYAYLLHDFREQELGNPVPKRVTKADVERAANEELRPDLDKELWRVYRKAGRFPDTPARTLKDFTTSHQPFHWFVEFPEAMAAGGLFEIYRS